MGTAIAKEALARELQMLVVDRDEDAGQETLSAIPAEAGDVSQAPDVQRDDVASLMMDLLSEEAGFITGATFVLDSGMTRKRIYLE